MKSLLSALVLSAASVLPVSAGLHDFNSRNAAPVPQQAQQRAGIGQGQCIDTRDRSHFCYLRTSSTNFSIAIRDVDYPSALATVTMDCSTGRWRSFGGLPKQTVQLYMDQFCVAFS